MDLASIGLKVDATQVTEGARELDKLVVSGKRAEMAVDQLGNQSTQTAGEMRAAAAATVEMGNASQRAQQQIVATTASAGQQRAGMQQLSFQIGDVAQQFALGTNPMIIFAQQGGQVVQALDMMQGGSRGLVGFLAGPWGAVLMGAATIAGMFGAKMLESAGAADAFTEALRKVENQADRSAAALNQLRGLQKMTTQDAVVIAQMELNKLTEERMKLEIAMSRRPRNPDGSAMFSYSDQQRVKEISADMLTLQGDIARGEASLNQLGRTVEKAAVQISGGRGRSSAAAGAAGRSAGEKFVEEFEKAVASTQASNMADIIRANSAREKQMASEAKAASDEMTDVLNKNADARIAKVGQEIEANKAWSTSLMVLIDQFDQLGSVGKGIGNVLAALDGFSKANFGAVGGKVGVLLNGLFTNVDGNGNRVLNRLGTVFSDALDRVFGQNGRFFQALQGAGTGTAIGGILFGDNKGAQIGGAIGGALGSFLGPVGNLVGSIIGSTIGSLFKSAKFGSAVVGSGGVTAGGNNADSRSAATTAGGAVSSAISRIAEALGGSVGNYSVSIGETDGKWRISTTGRSGELKSKYSDVQVFGKGEAGYEAAMRAAIADAIADGAITGVSEAVARLLKGGTNIDEQVRKAQLFQGVFSALKAETDPLGAALESVTKEFDALRKIFAEAGASAAEYASLEQLLAVRRQKAIDDARQGKVDKLADQFNLQIRALELMGKGEEALAATRLFQLAGIKESLQPLQQLVFQLEDARAVIDKFGPLAEDLRSYRNELLTGGQGASLATARSNFRSVAEAAANGDASALAKLRGVSGTYLEAMRSNASSSLDYRRAFGEVLAGVDRGIFAADAQVEYAQLQIDAIKANSDILTQMRADMNTLQGQIVSNTAFMLNLWKRFEGEGLPIRTQDEPLQVEIVS